VLGLGETTARLRTAHRLESGMLQHGVDRVTAVVGWPGFVVVLLVAIVAWVGGNLVARGLGLAVPDPPPFAGLQGVTATGALVIACLILTTQRREDKLADHRGQLILELAIANDQKIAKIIGLIEESRRDNPAISNRVDAQAATMSTPSNADEVMEVIRGLSEDSA
jgi:uncharacterized membrane protein